MATNDRKIKTKPGPKNDALPKNKSTPDKSRLTAALLERLATEPHTRIRYFCSPQHTGSASYPIISQMERAARLAHDDTAQARLDKLDAVLAQTSTSIQDAALFSLSSDGRYPCARSSSAAAPAFFVSWAYEPEAASQPHPVLLLPRHPLVP